MMMGGFVQRTLMTGEPLCFASLPLQFFLNLSCLCPFFILSQTIHDEREHNILHVVLYIMTLFGTRPYHDDDEQPTVQP
jgi:hypothetical protein